MIRCHDSWNINAPTLIVVQYGFEMLVIVCVCNFGLYYLYHLMKFSNNPPLQDKTGAISEILKVQNHGRTCGKRHLVIEWFYFEGESLHILRSGWLIDVRHQTAPCLKSCLPYISSAGSGHPGSSTWSDLRQRLLEGGCGRGEAGGLMRTTRSWKRPSESMPWKGGHHFVGKKVGGVKGYWPWGSGKKASKDWCFMDGEDMSVYAYICIHLVI